MRKTWTNEELNELLKGGVIMDVTNVEQAKIAEKAGASAVMALEKVPAQIIKEGGIARSSDPKMIIEIMNAVNIPVMAKCRIGHIAEAQVLQAIGIDYIDESEVLTPADHKYHIDKTEFIAPFVCGATNLAEALRRVNEGASMIRTKGKAGTGDIAEAVNNLRTIDEDIEMVKNADDYKLHQLAVEYRVPYELLLYVHKEGRIPVLNLSAGGVATPQDAALLMQLGAEGIFVGSGVFMSENPEQTARAIVLATKNYKDAKKVAEYSAGLGEAMR